MTESSYFGQFMAFNIIDKEGIYAVGYNKDNTILMIILELNDKEKQEKNKQYKCYYVKGVPASLAYSMSKGLDLDCFNKCLSSGKYEILAYEYV